MTTRREVLKSLGLTLAAIPLLGFKVFDRPARPLLTGYFYVPEKYLIRGKPVDGITMVLADVPAMALCPGCQRVFRDHRMSTVDATHSWWKTILNGELYFICGTPHDWPIRYPVTYEAAAARLGLTFYGPHKYATWSGRGYTSSDIA
jgi:hypothetical protein